MIYGTYGLNCEKYRFKRRKRNNIMGMYSWQRVKKWWIFWLPSGKPFYDRSEMFFEIK